MQNRPLIALLVLCLPMTLLWLGATAHCVRECLRARAGDERWSRLEAPEGVSALDAPAWLLLLVLSGWLGALAYVAVLLAPRLTSPRRRPSVASAPIHRRLIPV